MSLSTPITNLLLLLYKNINRTGIFNIKRMQSLFISSYFVYKKYIEDATAKLIKKHPEFFQDGHILDIGANVGYTAYVFSKALSPTYKIFAFEPEKRNLDILRKAASSYHFKDNLVITAAAVGNKEGEIEIWQNDGHHADHRVLTDDFRKNLTGTFQIQKTPLVTIDHFLKMNNVMQPIAFIKIDVQGYELAVCQGMMHTLTSNPNCIVSFEYSPSIMKALGYYATELIQFFQHRNYHFYSLQKNGSLKPLDINTDRDIQLQNEFSGYFDIVCSLKSLI